MGNRAVSRKPKTNIPEWLKRFTEMDVILVLAVVSVITIGLVMVYSSSWYYSLLASGWESTSYTVQRQVFWLVIGIICAIIASFVDYHHYQKLIVPVMFITIGLLIAVLIVPSNSDDLIKRSLFGGSVQPSELAKIVTVLYLAVWLNSKRAVLSKVSFGLLPLGLILGVVSGLIFLQPDLSVTLTIIILGAVLFFSAGAEFQQIVKVILVMVVAGSVFILLYKTGQSRLIDYWNGIQDPTQASDHVRISLEAIVNGGIFGQGLGQGSIKSRLPVAWTDSIYSVITEEFGLFGAVIVMALFLTILWRGIRIAQKSPDFLGKILASGITFWLIWEALINMGGMVNIFPFPGNALPFMSTGGSNLVTALGALGILLNISRMSNKESKKERNESGAVVDLRRWNGRRRVPRTIHAAENE